MRLRCFFGFHKLYVIKEFSATSRKVGCRRCTRAWGMNDTVQAFLRWTGEFDELYAGWPEYVAPHRDWRTPI